MKIEIGNLERQKQQNPELEEDMVLRKLIGEYEDLQKRKEV
jgi:hypothetical protein